MFFVDTYGTIPPPQSASIVDEPLVTGASRDPLLGVFCNLFVQLTFICLSFVLLCFISVFFRNDSSYLFSLSKLIVANASKVLKYVYDVI